MGLEPIRLINIWRGQLDFTFSDCYGVYKKPSAVYLQSQDTNIQYGTLHDCTPQSLPIGQVALPIVATWDHGAGNDLALAMWYH